MATHVELKMKEVLSLSQIHVAIKLVLMQTVSEMERIATPEKQIILCLLVILFYLDLL